MVGGGSFGERFPVDHCRKYRVTLVVADLGWVDFVSVILQYAPVLV